MSLHSDNPARPAEGNNGAGAALSEDTLQRLIDGRLSETETTQVQDRLKSDATSRRLLDALREEDTLLKDALEPLSEPSVRIGDKVMSVLYAEHRQRVALERARWFRNRVAAAVSIAAVFMFAVWVMQPRPSMGLYVSGTTASVVRADGQTAILSKDTLLYEGDSISTSQGQFVRLRLADGSRVDLDESSRLKFDLRDKKKVMSLEAGRVGIRLGSQLSQFTVQTPSGQVRAESGASFDLWLPQPCQAQLPLWTGPWQAEAPALAAPAPSSASFSCLSVLSGSVTVTNAAQPQGSAIYAGRRMFFGSNLPASDGVLAKQRSGLDTREGWSEAGGTGPQDRGLLGLSTFNWADLGKRLNLADLNTASKAGVDTKMNEAIRLLAEAQNFTNPAERAARLAQGQAALRSATTEYQLNDERRLTARTLEGLTHYQRGRLLLTVNDNAARLLAREAFRDASVAFYEALNGVDGQDIKLLDRTAPRIAVGLPFSEYTTGDQAYILASFYQPWAILNYQAMTKEFPVEGKISRLESESPVQAFDKAANLLGRTVESWACRHGAALADREAGHLQESIARWQELTTASLAGASAEARRSGEGLRQAAYLELVNAYQTAQELDRVEKTVDEFFLRYPTLQAGTETSPVAEQLKKFSK
jgi:ferric-dicitrate binding protein FerR (iron transport regulator)